MITIKSKEKSFGIKFPTSIDEITNKELNKITSNIKLPKHYCIIALCFETKLFDFCASMNSNKNVNIGVIPLLAKISNEDSETVNANVGDKIIIDRSSLERGVHVNINTVISSNVARRYLNSDIALVKSIITKSDEAKEYSNSNIIIVEFKIIPVTDISAAIPVNAINNDPFIVANVGNKAN